MLNESQQQAVDFDQGPALVLAGAGTGKTRVLVHRTSRLLQKGVRPQRILLITFTRRSAQELKERVGESNPEVGTLPWCGTFHSTAARLLRLYGHVLDLPPNFSILDEEDSAGLLWTIVNDTYSKEERKRLPRKSTLSKLRSYCANTQRELDDVIYDRFPKFERVKDEIRGVLAEYEERKKAQACADYDDLLILWLELLRQGPPHLRQMFEYIMVDEYQDTNVLQAAILQELATGTRNIMVVGDDAQSIYAFRGATVENILGFEKDFQDAAQMRLELNYRSTQEVLNVCNSLLAEAKEGFMKELKSFRGGGVKPRVFSCYDDWEQAEKLMSAIYDRWQNDGVPLREQAVLFRSSFHSFKFETVLQRHGIPYKKFGGIRFADSAHVKDVFTFLRCRENPWDESAWHRVLEMLPGVGPATAAKLFSELVREESPAVFLNNCKLPKKAEKWRSKIAKVFNILFAENEPPVLEQVETVLKFYKKIGPDIHDNWESRARDLDVLLNIASRYETRREMLDDISVGDDSVFGRAQKQEGEYLTLSTIHSAKGCEWDCVYVIQLIEGGMPIVFDDDEASKEEEERRLLYVAMTRARDHLGLFYPTAREDRQQRYVMIPCQISRFLTPGLLRHCDTLGAASASPSTDFPDDLQYDYSDQF